MICNWYRSAVLGLHWLSGWLERCLLLFNQNFQCLAYFFASKISCIFQYPSFHSAMTLKVNPSWITDVISNSQQIIFCGFSNKIHFPRSWENSFMLSSLPIYNPALWLPKVLSFYLASLFSGQVVWRKQN